MWSYWIINIPGSIGGEATISKLIETDPDVKAIILSYSYNEQVMANDKV